MELATNETVGVKKVTKEVWAIIEREPLRKAIWRKIGVAWENRDGSMKVVLDTVPIRACDILIRDPQPFDEARRPAAFG
jgi:hypothetical protein